MSMIKHDDKWLGLFLTMSANFQVNVMISSSYYFDNFLMIFSTKIHIFFKEVQLMYHWTWWGGKNQTRNLGIFSYLWMNIVTFEWWGFHKYWVINQKRHVRISSDRLDHVLISVHACINSTVREPCS